MLAAQDEPQALRATARSRCAERQNNVILREARYLLRTFTLMSQAIVKFLERTPSLRGATERNLEAFAESARTRRFHRREALWRVGDPVCYFTIIKAGIVKIVRQTSSGRRVICNIVGAPDSVGDVAVLKAACFPAGAVAATDVEVIEIPRALVVDALHVNAAMANAVLDHTQRMLRQLLCSIDVLSAGSVETRLATLLLTLYERFGDDFEDGSAILPIPLTRQDLADLVSTTQETTIRVMSNWERRGLVGCAENGFFFQNFAELKSVAGHFSGGSQLAAE